MVMQNKLHGENISFGPVKKRKETTTEKLNLRREGQERTKNKKLKKWRQRINGYRSDKENKN